MFVFNVPLYALRPSISITTRAAFIHDAPSTAKHIMIQSNVYLWHIYVLRMLHMLRILHMLYMLRNNQKQPNQLFQTTKTPDVNRSAESTTDSYKKVVIVPTIRSRHNGHSRTAAEHSSQHTRWRHDRKQFTHSCIQANFARHI